MPEFHFINEVLRPYLRESRLFKKKATQISDSISAGHLERILRGYWLSENPDDMKLHRKVITGKVISQYRERRKQEGVKPLTIVRELSLASSACKFVWSEHNKAVPNPFVGRLIGRMDRQTVVPRTRTITYEEGARLLNACRPELAEILVFVLETGLRRSELTELTWDQVRLDLGLILFNPDQQKNGTFGAVALSPVAMQILLAKEPKTGLVFGKKRNWMFKWLKAACKASGVDCTLHDLRRTCGSRLREKYGLEVAQAQLRHKTRRITETVYARPTADIVLNAFKNGRQVFENTYQNMVTLPKTLAA